MTTPDYETPLTSDERAAMRAYLQRTEVRLSTLHRIAIAFISGAGLLILLPVFFKEEIVALIHIFLANVDTNLPIAAETERVLKPLLYLCLAYPFILSFSIPIYSLYLLIKDVVHFYYSIYSPGYPEDLITPSFAMTGITFAPDESERVKKMIWQSQYNATSINFAIPFSAEKRELYFDETIHHTERKILPSSRLYEDLVAKGALPTDADRLSVERLNTAFGLARTIDRPLVEEVARAELSVVRHILYLRRLVIRYVRTLLMFIWTAFLTFIMLPFVEDPRLPTFLMLAVGYALWSILVIPVARLPLGWIYRHKRGIPDKNQLDRQLTTLEEQMRPFVYAAIAMSLVAVAICVPLYWGV